MPRLLDASLVSLQLEMHVAATRRSLFSYPVHPSVKRVD